jgi:hypothetical protein
MNVSLEPLRWLLHPVALLAFAAAAQAWIDGAAVRGIVAAVLGVLIAGATEAARRRVEPVARAEGRGWKHAQAGYGLVELLIAIVLLLLVIWLVFALVGDADAAELARSSWGLLA